MQTFLKKQNCWRISISVSLSWITQLANIRANKKENWGNNVNSRLADQPTQVNFDISNASVVFTQGSLASSLLCPKTQTYIHPRPKARFWKSPIVLYLWNHCKPKAFHRATSHLPKPGGVGGVQTASNPLLHTHSTTKCLLPRFRKEAALSTIPDGKENEWRGKLKTMTWMQEY